MHSLNNLWKIQFLLPSLERDVGRTHVLDTYGECLFHDADLPQEHLPQRVCSVNLRVMQVYIYIGLLLATKLLHPMCSVMNSCHLLEVPFLLGRRTEKQPFVVTVE